MRVVSEWDLLDKITAAASDYFSTSPMENRKKSRGRRVTERQLRLMVNYMSAHSGFAIGRFTDPKEQLQQWEKLSIHLNDNGPHKNVEQWKKTWRDLKRNSRAKAARLNSSSKETDNLSRTNDLTDLESKCLAVIQTEVDAEIQKIEDTAIECLGLEEDSRSSAGPAEDGVLSSSHSDHHLEVILKESRGTPKHLNGKSNAAASPVDRHAAALEKLAAAAEKMAAAAAKQANATSEQTAAMKRNAVAIQQQNALLERLNGLCGRMCERLERKNK